MLKNTYNFVQLNADIFNELNVMLNYYGVFHSYYTYILFV